jgi:glycosyltransferase involved in cell wall biosynthesis
MSASLAILMPTYNQPDYLRRVLRALDRQTMRPDEVLLADDGSDADTGQLFEEWRRANKVDAKHVWQPHDGYRKTRILNAAIAQARSDYIVFLDGDTLPHPEFVADHRRLIRPQVYIQGHRTLVEQKAATYFGSGDFARDRLRAFWSKQLSNVKHSYRWPIPFKHFRADAQGSRGCNFGVWRQDLIRVNGYNEALTGWGREDSEIAVRLMNSGVRRLDVRGWALCYHLWHPPAKRGALNDQILEKAAEKKSTRCELGLDRHLSK